MRIANTDVEAACDWPDGTFIQGGSDGLVLVRNGDNYTTAFVEVHNDTIGFIRGEGATIGDAEQEAWEKAQAVLSCESLARSGEHEWESRGYTNGAGFCKTCNRFGSQVFDVSEVGIPCYVCGVKTNWQTFGTNPGSHLCQDHGLPSNQDPYRAAALISGAPIVEVFGHYPYDTWVRFAALMDRFTLEEIASFATPEHLRGEDFAVVWEWKKEHEQQWADQIREQHRSGR